MGAGASGGVREVAAKRQEQPTVRKSGPLTAAHDELETIIARRPSDPELRESLRRVVGLIDKGRVDSTMSLEPASPQNREAAAWVSTFVSEANRMQQPRGTTRRRRAGVHFQAPEHSVLLGELAHMMAEKDQLAKAEATVARTHDKESAEFGLAVLGRGTVKATVLGKHEEAMEDFGVVIALAEKKAGDQSFAAIAASAWHKKGDALRQLGKLEKAIEARAKAFEYETPHVHETALTSYIELALQCSEDWELFDVEMLETASRGRAISAYAAHALGVRPYGNGPPSDAGVLAKVSEDGTVSKEQVEALVAFTQVLDAEYAATSAGKNGGSLGNPYHNRLHGADVMQATNLLCRHQAIYAALDDIAALAVLFAAMVHDFRHPGVNEQFLVETTHALAIRYSDDSTLERMHLAEVFELLAKPGHDWIRAPKDVRRRVRSMVIHCVLGTDLARSSYNVGVFEGHCDAGSNFSTHLPAQQALACIVVKLADVSHPARRKTRHLRWSRRIMAEFFNQGRDEAKAGLPISPLCDEATVDLPKAQRGFIDFVTRPILNAVYDFCSTKPSQEKEHSSKAAIQVAKTLLDENYEYWGGDDCKAIKDAWARDPEDLLTPPSYNNNNNISSS
ncbi:hypothetical protein CTAYLR_010480 [Chrysophaeum taylorii]|uniref:PDEase domain-containing protein n=1 Tax=Chrysophaeum taylorii TaxID=2483200 RepID=A0AAD7ULF8_9STRA|nr:hypothetical protein CTAYLR_010480 [Chrysophaeum taylorii]